MQSVITIHSVCTSSVVLISNHPLRTKQTIKFSHFVLIYIDRCSIFRCICNTTKCDY